MSIFSTEQSLFLITCYGLIAGLSFIVGLRETYSRNNPYGLTRWLLPYGIFVWGDAVIIGLFWTIASFLSVYLQNMQLFIILQAAYWIVRSAGEVLYWFLQQFASVKRDPPHTLLGHKLFPGESIWFAYQVGWQMVLVVAIVSLLYQLKLV